MANWCAATCGGVAAAAAATAVAMPAVGFAAGGVAKHSIAAAAQSAIGNVPAQSAFAIATCAGAIGAPWTLAKTAAAAGGLAWLAQSKL